MSPAGKVLDVRINVMGLGEEGVEAEDQVSMPLEQLNDPDNDSISVNTKRYKLL